MIGRCANNDEQLRNIETRVACLKGLKNGINLSELDQSCDNIVLNDTMRFFHGDELATALEAGNQKGEITFAQAVMSIYALLMT